MKYLLYFIFTIFLCCHTYSILAKDNKKQTTFVIESAETEINLILTELLNLENILFSIEKINNDMKWARYKPFVQENFRNGLDYFYKKDFRSAIRELKIYLNNTQNFDEKEYFKSQYLLGICYEHLNMTSMAVSTYKMYLSSYISHMYNNYTEFLDVLHRLSKLLNDSNYLPEKITISDIILALTAKLSSANWPSHYKAQVYFYVAYLSTKLLNFSSAVKWFEKALEYTEDKTFKAQIIYFYALCFVFQNRMDITKKHLKIIINDYKNHIAEKYLHLTYLSLARIYVEEKDYNQALKYYSYIDDKSLVYSDAMFESLVVFLKLSAYDQAIVVAKNFLNKFKDDPRIFDVKRILTYLDLKSSNVLDIKSDFKLIEEQLDQLQNKLRVNYANKSIFRKEDLVDIMSMTKGIIPDVSVIKDSVYIFQKLTNLNQRTIDIKNEINRILYVISTYNLDILDPNSTRRIEQLDTIIDKALELGHKLVAVERLYKKRYISDFDLKKLIFLEERRINIASSKLFNIKSRMKLWSKWMNLYQLNLFLQDSYAKLNETKSTLAAIKILSLHTSNTHWQNKVNQLEVRADVLNDKAIKILSRLRIKQYLDHIYTLKYGLIKDLYLEYVNILKEEASILEKYRYKNNNAIEKIMNENLRKAWNLWQNVSKSAYDALGFIKGKLNWKQENLVSKIKVLIEHGNQLSSKLKETSDKLTQFLVEHTDEILQDYISIIENHKSKIRKWKADVKLYEYEATKLKEHSIQDKYNIQHDIFNYEYNTIINNNYKGIFKWLE